MEIWINIVSCKRFLHENLLGNKANYSTILAESFEQDLFSYNSYNQQSNENKTYSKIFHVIERIDHAGYFALFDMLIPRQRMLSVLVNTRDNANRWLDKEHTKQFLM